MHPTRRARVLLPLTTCLFWTTWPVPASAEPREPAASQEVHAKASRGQSALTLRVVGGQVRAGVCAKPPCSLGEDVIDVSEEVSALGAPASSRIEVLELGRERRAVHVRWGSEPSYHLVLAGPLRGAAGAPSAEAAPLVLHRGWSDRLQGLEGERVTSHVEVIGGDGPPGSGSGVRQLVVGELRENLSLCGRPALVAPLVLDPVTLSFKPARLQRLPARERRVAPEVVAEPVAEADPGAMTLWPVAASSAVGRPGHVSDGDLETTWAEGGGGAGRGEFILLRAPGEVRLEAFEFVSRPPSGGEAPAAGPRSFWLVGDEQLVRVEVPTDPWETPGARLRVQLPEPWRTGCVAWVAEEAYGSGAELQVTLAELVAVPEGGAVASEELIEWIVAEDDRVARAVALLAARPAEAGPLVARALPEAPDRARRQLLDVADRLSCAEGAPGYAAALAVGDRELSDRASRGLRRCSGEAPQALLSALEGAAASAETRLAQELAPLAPALAVERLTPRLAVPSPARRAGLRQALAEASRSPAAADAVRRMLADATLPALAQVDLLRALGAGIESFQPEASAALRRLLEGASFRERYLLLGPAVHLSGRDAHARAFVSHAVRSDARPAVRAAAAATLGEVFGEGQGNARNETQRGRSPFEGELLAALEDDNVRVRDAAARSLGALGSPRASAALLRLLAEDRWPLVRQGAISALGELGAGTDVEQALGGALVRDASSHVRAAAARALGVRGAPSAAKWLGPALSDGEQPAEVRQEAARALGAICATSSSPILVKAALRLTDPHLDADERRVSVAALKALAELRPPGLKAELEPLLRGKVPKQVRGLANQAVAPRAAGRAACGAAALSRGKR